MECQLRRRYDALSFHLFWHVLDRRVALIFWLFIITFSPYIRAGRIFIRGILTSFYGFSQGQRQHWTSQRTATTTELFLDVSVAGIIGSVFLTTTKNPLYSCIGWLIHDTELCSSVNPVSSKCTLPMNPMDAQRYDLSKRSVSL